MKIALIAHDRLKPAFVVWVRKHEATFAQHHMVATGTTGTQIKLACPGLDIALVKSGPLGGDQQIGAMIADGLVGAVIFMADPLTPMPHDVDVKALVRLSTLYNIPMACNEATADLVVGWLTQMVH
ncbi:MAG TPA: methylglyoxal synthase [Aliidongia sp.]|uniref:methylglyoxal synthase n=1 Tax=Aliidongia sp. TaxID=1914230 RepID=UPI002DDCE6C5|nr:methylglyoxal synthase [Aliidongia sp.]HEV2675663.1 methylglyoxal synthase [Aliidongia sp.]